MAVRDTADPLFIFPKNIRDAIAYRHTINALLPEALPMTGAESLESLAAWIRLHLQTPTVSDSFSSSEQLRQTHLDYLIPLKKFDWLKKNERACYWLWLNIKNGKLQPIGQGEIHGRAATSHQPYSDFSGLPHNPSSHNERLEALIKYSDLIHLKANEKNRWLDDVKSLWQAHPSSKERYLWMGPISATSAYWIWDYVNSSTTIPHHMKPTYQPLTTEEAYKTALAIIDCWRPASDTFELFLIKIKKAWSQKKFRDKQGDRKQYSFSLRPLTKDLLKQLAEKQNLKPNELLEKLIDRAITQDIKDQNSHDETIMELAKTRRALADLHQELDQKTIELEQALGRYYTPPPNAEEYL